MSYFSNFQAIVNSIYYSDKYAYALYIALQILITLFKLFKTLIQDTQMYVMTIKYYYIM